MAEPIAFYFDFISPYAYLGSVGIMRVAEKHGRAVDWRPTLLGVSVLKVMGLKAVPDTPLKGAYFAHDWPRSARLMGIPHLPGAPVQFAPLPAARAFTHVKDRDAALAVWFGQAVFRAHWAEGRDMSSPGAVAEVAGECGIEPGEVLAAMSAESVKSRLREHVHAALDAGVFGTPTFIVEGEMFWGADRLDQVDRWIATGGW